MAPIWVFPRPGTVQDDLHLDGQSLPAPAGDGVAERTGTKGSMSRQTLDHDRRCIAFVSDYVPRQCGIATFTQNICEAVAEADPEHDVIVVAMNDTPEGYPYPNCVRFEVRQAIQADYRLAAEYLNINQVSVVCLQHEYGIFGGPCGSHVLSLLRWLRRPLVTTLHTVLKSPSEQELLVLEEIAALSSRLIVTSDLASKFLQEVYEVPPEKIATVPHGIPDVPFVDLNFYKDLLGVEGKKVLLTFGLLSPNNGIEYVIDALPAIVRKHPDVAYIVLGATHPQVRREHGEEYRNSLQRRVNELGLSDHVIFQNRFVTLKELCEFLGAADIYVSPYVNEAQIVSGTLSYALGAGKAVISTPYWYATEMLGDGRGKLVPFRNAEAIAETVIELFDNETERHAMRKRAYTYCRSMIWPEVAQQYLRVFAEASTAWVHERGQAKTAPARQREMSDELPEVDLRHLRRLTDDTGVIQHCNYNTPNRRLGYTTDDNARALITTAMYWQQSQDHTVIDLMHTYLAFLSDAMDPKSGRFRNLMHYNRNWEDGHGSEDGHARAMWALGIAAALCPHESMIALATRLFVNGLAASESLASPRAWAFVIIGCHAYLRRFSGDLEVKRCRVTLSERLANHFTQHMTDDWPWCEETLTYANAKLPHALLMSGKWMQRGDMIDLGKRVLRWLIEIQTNQQGMLSLIGTEGWYTRGGTKARHDQQPIDAHALLHACVGAYQVTREEYWITQAHKALNWFLGENDLRIPLYDFTTGGCRDGLHSDRANENQGAESTMAWLMSLLLMQQLQAERNLERLAGASPARKGPAGAAAPQEPTPAKAKEYVRSDSDDK